MCSYLGWTTLLWQSTGGTKCTRYQLDRRHVAARIKIEVCCAPFSAEELQAKRVTAKRINGCARSQSVYPLSIRSKLVTPMPRLPGEQSPLPYPPCRHYCSSVEHPAMPALQQR